MKNTFNLILFFVIGIQTHFSQNMEILGDFHGDKMMLPHIVGGFNNEPVLIGDNLFTFTLENQGGNYVNFITVTNLKSKQQKKQLVWNLKSLYHFRVNLHKRYLTYQLVSPGVVKDGKLAVLVQSIDKKNNVNLSRIVLDDQLNVVEEELLLSYERLDISFIQTLMEQRLIKYDQEKSLFFYGEYSLPNSKSGYLRIVILSNEMKILSDNEYYPSLFYTKEAGGLDTRKSLHSIKIIDEETVFINILNQLKILKENEVTSLEIELEHNITSYVVKSKGEKDLRLTGIYSSADNEFGLAVIDIDFNSKSEEFEVGNNEFIPLPKNSYLTEKELSGVGYDIDSGPISFHVKDFKLLKDGTSEIVIYLKNYRSAYNISVIKLDAQLDIIDEVTLPYFGDENFDILFDEIDIKLLCSYNNRWFNEQGEFDAKNYENNKYEGIVLTNVTIKRDNFIDLKMKQLTIENKSVDPSEELLNFHNVKLEDGSYLVIVSDKSSSSFKKDYTRYIGKINL